MEKSNVITIYSMDELVKLVNELLPDEIMKLEIVQEGREHEATVN